MLFFLVIALPLMILINIVKYFDIPHLYDLIISYMAALQQNKTPEEYAQLYGYDVERMKTYVLEKAQTLEDAIKIVNTYKENKTDKEDVKEHLAIEYTMVNGDDAMDKAFDTFEKIWDGKKCY